MIQGKRERKIILLAFYLLFYFLLDQGKPAKEASLYYKLGILWDAAIREAFRLKCFEYYFIFSKFVCVTEIFKSEAL